jgi:hypothetical protein
MCGRFVLKAPFSERVRLYDITNIAVNLEPRYWGLYQFRDVAS